MQNTGNLFTVVASCGGGWSTLSCRNAFARRDTTLYTPESFLVFNESSIVSGDRECEAGSGSQL
jgi:tRNA A58 N-methylase Trm61